MKKLLLLFSTALTMLFTGCSQFDDSRIWDAIDELEDLYDDLDGRLEKLEEECQKMNTNIEALQTLVTALQNHDTITSIAPIKQGDEIVGYTITFSQSEPITIYHGTDGKDGADGEDGKDGADGKDGYTPTIGVAQDEDGIYYWTLDGEWLLDENGNKIKAVGEDGKDGANGNDGANGENGSNGENGENGKDGITPQLEIRDGYWYISYDNGATWKELGKATGEDGKDGADGEDGKDGEDGTNGTDGQDGKDGDSLFQSVTWDEEYAYFTLADGTVIKIPLSEGAVSEVLDVNINHFYAGFPEGADADGVHAYFVILSDSYDVITEEWDNEESGFIYNLCFCSNVNANVVPNGTYNFSDIYEANTVRGVEGTLCMIVNNDEWSYHDGTEGVVTISNNKLEATFTLDNGEVHHVVYEGSLKLYEEGEEEEDTPTPPANEIWYTSTDGEVVEVYTTNCVGNAAFDAEIISNTYENGKGVITFDNEVTSIGEMAFDGCSTLVSVTFSDRVTEIGERAFAFCSSLTNITIPDSVTSIGASAFSGCSSLASITIPDSVTSIGAAAFEGCSNLESITIPDSVTSIGDSAFFECVSFESITIPGSVTSIGEHVFRGCSNLASVTIEEGVTSIGYCAFWDCSSLVSIIIPDSVTSIGYCAFDECLSLESIIIPDSVTSIGGYAFHECSSLASVTIGSGVTSIGERAFRYCSSLASVTIPDSVTSIGEEAFDECSSLASVTIGSGVTSIGRSAFSGCESLTEVHILDIAAWCGIDFGDGFANPLHCAHNLYLNGELVTNLVVPDSVTEIGYWAFERCESLVSIVIPDSVTSIGERAFIGCSSLASVSIGNGVTSIGDYAFYNCSSLTSVTIGNSVSSIGTSAFGYCSSLASVTIPDSVTSIGEWAFEYCSSLASVTIPDSVTSIGDGAFAGCSSLASVTIPDSVTSIGDYAFYNCSSLASVTIPDSVTSIGNYAFSYCYSLASITIPDSVVEIGDAAFGWCYGLETVTIGSGVEYLGYSLFYYCESLMYVFCNSTTPPIFAHSSDKGGTFYLPRAIYVPAGSEEAYKTADGWSDYADIIGVYEPEKYGSWLGSYTISGIGSVYDSEADSRVEREVEFTITVEAKDESTLSYNVTGWDGCPYPITAYYGSEDELILSAGMVVEGLDLGDGTYSDMGDLYCVGVLEDNYILTGGPIIKLSKDANQVVGITTNGNEVLGITFCFQAYEDGLFYLLKRYGLLYTPMDMAMSSGASYAPKKAVAFGGRNLGIDRTRTLRVVK